MNQRPNWEPFFKANQVKIDEQAVQKTKKVQSTANLIDQIIEQSQMAMENQYANPLDAGDTPFPHIQYALKNVEQEKLLQDLINKSKTCQLVVENHKQKVREIVLKNKKLTKGNQYQKEYKDQRKDSLQQYKNQEDPNNDLENLDEQFNKFLQEKQKSFSLDNVEGYDQTQDEIDQQRSDSICSTSRHNLNKQKLEDQMEGVKDSVDQTNQKYDNQKYQIKYNVEDPLRTLDYSDSLNSSQQNNLLLVDDNLLEVQPLERSRKTSRDRKLGLNNLNQMMKTEESIHAVHKIEDSANLDDESEYLDHVPMMEDQVIDYEYSSMDFDQKKHQNRLPNIQLQEVQEESTEYDYYHNNNSGQNKREKKPSIDDISLLSPNEVSLESPKLTMQTLNNIRTIVQYKLKMRKSRALSQSEIQNMLSPLPKTQIQFNDETANKCKKFIQYKYTKFKNILKNLQRNPFHPSNLCLQVLLPLNQLRQAMKQSSIKRKIQYFYQQYLILKKNIIKPNKEAQYIIRLVGNYINEVIHLDLDLQGHSSLKKQLDQYTVWPLVLEGLKKQFILEGLDDLIFDKTMNDGQYLMQDQESYQNAEGQQDQTVEEIKEWKTHLSMTNIIELESPQKKSFKLIQKPENLQFTNDGALNKSKKASSYYLKQKYQLTFFTNFDKGNSKFLGDIDLRSVCSIKNLISLYLSSCYQFTNKVNGRMYVKREVQNDVNFIQSQKTIHEICKLQKALSRSQSNHSKKFKI